MVVTGQTGVTEAASELTGTALPPVGRPPAAGRRQFLFDLDENVTISASKEEGIVRARAEWATGNMCYFIAYTSSRGEFREAWIDEDLLSGDL